MESQTGDQVWPLRSVAAPRLATLGDRALAQVVDGLIGLGFFFFTGMMLASRFGVVTETGFELTSGPALLLVGIVTVVMLSYFILAEAMFGATLGKVVAQIGVENDAGLRIGLGASTIRNAMRLVDIIGFYLVGAISILATKRNQRLGDLAAGTVVVRRELGRAPRLSALAVALILAIGGLVGGLWLRDPGLALPPTLEQYAPKAKEAVIKAVSLSSSGSTELDPSQIGTQFPEGVRQVVVWYYWDGAKQGHKADVRWFRDGSLIREETGEILTQPVGSSAWFLNMAAGTSLPSGNYEVELLENGKRVTAIPFRIGR